jgi:ubiquinone biosynthesis protein
MDSSPGFSSQEARGRANSGAQQSSFREAAEYAAAHPREAITVWLRLLSALLSAIEETVWQLRRLGADMGQVLREAQASWSEATQQGEIAAWSARLSRLTTTGFTLARVAAAYRFQSTKAAFMSQRRAARALEALHADSARRLVELSVRQGGAFLKVGQMLSARPDLLPAVYVRELSRLQDAVPEISFDAVREVIESELAKPLSELFAEFSEPALAAASIGQVHRARLHDGREVAVKVQRPGIDELVALDLDVLELFVKALARDLPAIDIDTIVSEVRCMVAAELDYVREARLTCQVSEFFAQDPNIRAPWVVSELSTRRVLVTTFMPGEKISDALDGLLAARTAGDESAHTRLTTILTRVLEAYIRQTLELGVFQADPHPGNLLVTAQDGVVLLDFGCAKEVSAEQRLRLVTLGQAFLQRDALSMAAAMYALGFVTERGTIEGLNAYAAVILREIGLVEARGGDWPNPVEMLAQAALLLRSIELDPIVKLPEEFVMLGRVFGLLSGLFLHYRPDPSAALQVLPWVISALSRVPRTETTDL